MEPIGRFLVSWTRVRFIVRAEVSCAIIAPLTRTGIRRFAQPVTIGGKSWLPDHDFTAPAGVSCAKGEISAKMIRLTPDGRTLLFMAALGSGYGETWALYEWAFSGGQPVKIAGGFTDPS